MDQRYGLALSLLIAKMSFSAYGASGIEGAFEKAWICVTCQGLGIALAILARRALTGQMMLSGVAAAIAAGGCAWWASHGLALAWARGGDPANDWMVFFLTALEPGIFLLAEHIKEGREALRRAQEQADRETAEALANPRAKDEASGPKPPANRSACDKATVTRLKLAEAVHQPTGQPVQLAGDLADNQTSDPPPPATSPAHSEHVFADGEAHARHLITVEGVRHRNELARRVRGLSHYRAAQLLDELDWREKAAVRKSSPFPTARVPLLCSPCPQPARKMKRV